MRTVSLQEYTQGRTLVEVAETLDVTPGAIWQMLRSDRRIEVTTFDDGRIEANEIRPVGRKKIAKAA